MKYRNIASTLKALIAGALFGPVLQFQNRFWVKYVI